MSKYTNRTNEWKKTRERILKRDNYICYVCGGEATQVDHYIPRSKGGSDEDSNLYSICARDNRLKSDTILTRQQWINPKYQSTLNKTTTTQNQNNQKQ